MRNDIVLRIATNSIVAALYFVLTLVTAPFSFLGLQFRVAEILVLLCFFRKDYTIGLTLGCLLANLFSPLGWPDIVFGSLATLLSCVAISFMKQLFIATLFPVVFNAFIVGAELHFVLEEPFWLNVGLVALGEFVVVSIVGYVFFMLVGKKDYVQRAIGARQNFRFRW